MVYALVWEEFLKIVSQEVGSHVVQTWLNAVTFSHWDPLAKIVYLKAPNKFVQEWVKSNYTNLFKTHLSRLYNVDEVKIVFVDKDAQKIVGASLHRQELTPAIIPAVSTGEIVTVQKSTTALKRLLPKSRSVLNKHYQFDNFVVGPSNQLAYAAAYAVTEKLGSLYNPLFIYGASGLGKTHLLHAIGNQIAHHKNVEILYQTADRFVSEFINAIRFDKITQFKARFKSIDVLLIDDIQFISNKEQTQEAFFHIFNILYEAQKQIVFTSDTDPAHIAGLADRLRSRFEWGLVTDIQKPTLETKIAILRHKAAKSMHKLSDDVLQYIATSSQSNIRQLEGALIRVTAFAALTDQPITLALTERVLSHGQDTEPKVVDFSAIIKLVQRHFSYSLGDLRSESRSKQLSLARQVAMYLMKKHTGKSLNEIGHFLNRKDHSTVLYGLQKVEQEIKNDRALYEHIRTIEKELSV